IDAVNSAYYDFANMRGDVSVAISTDYLEPSAIIEGMMNRSEDYDIFVLDMQNEAFGALYERGYMAELKGSEQIDELFKQLYPDVAERLSTDGVPVAVPLYCYGSAFGVNTEALEKAGLTMDDIPTNWCDLLDSLEELHAKLEDTGVALFYDFYTIRDIRSLLFGVIFEDYIAYMESVDPTMGFNTEVFNEVLAKLDAIDFAAMGYKEEINYEEEFNWGRETMLLFEPYIGCTMGDFYGTYEPVLLSLTPEIEPALKLTVSAAFINPYSKNYDIALEFLECAMGNVQEYVLASLCDIEVEPLRDRYYAENLQSAQESVAQLTQMLAEAEEAEKQALEESLMYAEQWLVDIEENNWEISPKAIEWYRANDDKIHIAQFNVLYSAETQNTAEISEYIMQYTEQEISAEEMLKGIDSKLQMMILEGN
ncbi:MAG: extracellular solute-binding protein, partial [Eubacteriales bacterium]|nr:extracellular solute-binding protein [Eubacteriales bacterium]